MAQDLPAQAGDLLAAYREAGYRAAGLWTDASLAGLVPVAAAAHPDRELFCYEGSRVSYGDFDTWTRVVALDLVRRGVHRGDRVLVQLPNRLEALVLQVAAFRAGAVDVPVVPIYRIHEMRQILADCRPAVVCSTATLGERNPAEELDGLFAELDQQPAVRYLVGGARPGWEPVPDAGSVPDHGPELPEPAPPDEPVLLLYTSGTTSAPKGALLSSRAVMAHLANFRDALGAGEHTVTLAATPLSHLAGFVAAVVFPVFLGGRSVIMPAWKPDEAVEVIARERVNLMMGATVFVSDLVQRYERGVDGEHGVDGGDGDDGVDGGDGVDGDEAAYRLATYAAAGATLAPEVVDRAASVGVDVVRAYGMTETAGVCAISSANEPLERRRAWDGRLLPGMEIQAVDDERRLVPPGEVGHLRIRGPQLLTGYTDERLTKAQIDDDGWFYPGDLGQVDDQGWVRIAGRTKDIVNRGGEKFSTLDIEQAIGSHPGVRAVAVTAVPDARLGEAVGAWLVVDDEVRSAGSPPLLAHLRERNLATQKFPVEWHLVTEIPVTASGKVQKHRLADLPTQQTWTTRPEGPRT